ncbi:ATP-binding protein [Candidatus Margulisiibacteriota bacterium]
MKYLNKLIPHKLWAQLALGTSFTVLISLMIMGLLLINTSQKTVTKSVLRDFNKLSITASQRIAGFIDEPKNLLINTASILSTVKNDKWKIETILIELKLNFDFFQNILYFDKNNNLLANSDPAQNFNVANIFKNIALNQKKVKLSEVYFTKESIPFIDLHVPVYSFNKKIGFLYAQVNLSEMWKMVDKIKFGKTGIAFVVSKNGRLLAHPDKKRVISNKIPEEYLLIKDKKLENINIRGFHLRELKRIISYSDISSLNWVVAISQSTKEAFYFLNIMKFTSWIIICLTVSIFMVLSIVFSNKIVYPLKILGNHTKEIAKGNFKNRIKLKRNDELGELIDSFNQMTLDLKQAKEQEKLALIGKTAAAIVHDIKNSVVLLHTYIQIFPKQYNNPDFVQKFIKVVPQEINRWMSMLQEIVDFSSRTKFELSELNLRKFIQEIQFLVEGKVKEQEINLKIKICTKKVLIKGNSEKLKRVIMNLVMNAIQATPPKNDLLIVLEKIQIKNTSYAELKVSDTGTGIDKDIINNIFEPFHSSKPNGLGLGLSICKEIISKHSGTIEAFNNKDKGATFRILIPLFTPKLTHLHNPVADFSR